VDHGKNVKYRPAYLQTIVSVFVLVVFGITFCQLRKGGFPTSPAKDTSSKIQVISVRPGEWRFIVSGDSRNCGDVVMPTIAAQSSRYAPSLYWHLGDLRAIYKTDEDMEAASAKHGLLLSCAEYHRRAWPDFIDKQIASFSGTPFFVGIGNHEVIPPKDENQFVSQFSDWLQSPVLNRQRREDGDKNPDLAKPYYHWIQQGIDFIYLDNASTSLSKEQLDWFDGVVKRAQANSNVLSLIVGMHEALPDSIASAHAMCDDPKKTDSCNSGRHVYDALVSFQRQKPVYVLASHSHFYMSGIFDNHPLDQRLPGWIVGTAGAVRYQLPQNAPSGAMTDVYGYLLGTVSRDGKVRFEFERVNEVDVPEYVRSGYPPWLVPWCFAHNSQNVDPEAEENTHRCVPPAPQSGH
jgi:hypothetical protein